MTLMAAPPASDQKNTHHRWTRATEDSTTHQPSQRTQNHSSARASRSTSELAETNDDNEDEDDKLGVGDVVWGSNLSIAAALAAAACTSRGETESGRGNDPASSGKLRIAEFPLMLNAATSWARAAISGVGKVPSHMRDFFRGSRISDTHLPHVRIRTPRSFGLAELEGKLECFLVDPGEDGDDEDDVNELELWWKMQVEDYLYHKDLYLPLVGEKPEAMNASEWAILDKKALATVRLNLTPQVAFNISKEKTTAAVMKALKNYMKNLLFRIRNNLVTTLSNSTIFGMLTLNDVVSSVMNDEMRRKTIGDGISSSTTLSLESRGRQNNKQNNMGRSPTRGRSKSRGKLKSKGKTIVCWNCNMEGHKKNDCTEPNKKKGVGGRRGDDEGANMVSSNKQTYDDLYLSAIMDDNSKVWYVDSGASIHCTPHRDCLCDYVHGDNGHVTVGNGYRCSVVGNETVEIKLSNGRTLVLKDVRHIPELQKNLISVSGLDRKGYFMTFSEKQWKMIKGLMVVARGERVGTIYTLSGTHNHSISLAFTKIKEPHYGITGWDI
ncbi:hypothetical protein RJ639_004004 [Escallonia herrerae]|uniref:CCHC-type domain-containing protein n=1 Tax=Escallonia herrerae TaxID=1293975 RepID=A0AA88W5T5_9ASTE|nr:hypothetical protein RJ639_004004 [Escallonia herrerae]